MLTTKLRKRRVASYLGAGVAFPGEGLATISRSALVNVFGDSTVRGFPNYIHSWTHLLAKRLTAKGVRASGQNLFGVGSSSFADLVARDSRVSFTGAWSQTATLGPGGNGDGASAAATRSFTPLDRVTRFDVYWRDGAAGRNFSASVDGGAATAVNSSGTTRPFKTSITAGALGNHALTLAWVAGSVTILGVDAYDDTDGVPMRIWNFGISGSTSAQMIDNTDAQAGRRAFYAYADADLSIIEGGINDWRQNVPVATFKANFTTLVQGQKATKSGSGKVVLLTPVFDADMTNNGPIQDQYVTAIKQVGAEQNVPVLDIRPFFKSHAYANRQGWMADSVHLTPAGNAEKARIVESAIYVKG